MKIFCKFFVAVTEKNFHWNFNFQFPQYKRAITVAGTEVVHDPQGLLSAIHVRYRHDAMATSKVWLVQYRDPDVRQISQIEIVMYFICNISAMPWQYRGRCHSDIVGISECPLGSYSKCVGETSPKRFSKKSKLSISLD